MKEIVAGLTKPDNLYANGLHVAGERFVVTNAQDRSLYAKKVRKFYAVYYKHLLRVLLMPQIPRPASNSHK